MDETKIVAWPTRDDGGYAPSIAAALVLLVSGLTWSPVLGRVPGVLPQRGTGSRLGNTNADASRRPLRTEMAVSA